MKKRIAGRRSRRSVRWLKLLCVFLACFMLWQIGSQYLRYQNILAEVDRHQEWLVSAQQQQVSLQNQLELLFNDSYLEQLARRNLGMVRAGEIVVMQAEITEIPELDPNLRDSDLNH